MNEDGYIITKPELAVPMLQLQAKTVIVSTQKWRIRHIICFVWLYPQVQTTAENIISIKLTNFTLLYTDYLQWRRTCILHPFFHFVVRLATGLQPLPYILFSVRSCGSCLRLIPRLLFPIYISNNNLFYNAVPTQDVTNPVSLSSPLCRLDVPSVLYSL